MKKLILILLFIVSIIGNAQTPLYKDGFPKLINGTRPLQRAGIPLVTDLDNDGKKEIVFVCGNSNVTVNVIKSNGNEYPGFPKVYSNAIMDIASGDVNGDGFNDLALRFLNSVDVIDRFGNSLPGFPVYYNDGTFDSDKFISLYDLDNDGKLEIIVNKLNQICVFNFNGQIKNGWPQYYPGQSRMNPSIGDIDNDGYAEIILATFKLYPQPPYSDSSAIRIYRYNGENYSNNWPIYYDSLYANWGASPSIFINRNNVDSTYILMPSILKLQGSITRSKLSKYDLQGNTLSKRYIEVTNGSGTIIIGDIDNDEIPEYASGMQNNLYLYNNHLNIIQGWDTNQGRGEHYATPIIGKVSFGNDLNVLANNWDAVDPNGYGNIFGYNKNGSSLNWSPIRPIGLVYGICLQDLDNDGNVELIAISTQTLNETYLHVWTIQGIPFSNSNDPWPMYGHDRYRTNQYGFVPPDEPVGIHPVSTVVPDRFSLFQNYPNPFNPSTTIKFDLNKSTEVKLTVFDILGRVVSILVNEKLNPGVYSINFNAEDLSAGTYFYSLQAGEKREIKKMMLIK